MPEVLIDYGWWILGLVLLALEVAAPGVYLLFFGIAALIVGMNVFFLGTGWFLLRSYDRAIAWDGRHHPLPTLSSGIAAAYGSGGTDERPHVAMLQWRFAGAKRGQVV